MTTIRLATPADASDCLELYSPYVRDTSISFELTPPTAEEFRERIDSTLETLPWLVCEAGDDILGYTYAGHYRTREAYQWVVESSVYVDGGQHRRGIARGLYTSLFELLRRQGYFTVLAGMTLPNPASVELHRAMGFEPVGVYEAAGYKRSTWHDVQWMQRRLRSPDADPDPPIALDELDASDRVNEALRLGLDEVGFESG